MRKSAFYLLISFGLLACGTQTTERSFDSTLLTKASPEQVEQVVEAFIGEVGEVYIRGCISKHMACI